MSIPSRSLPFPPSTLRSRLFLFLVPTLFLILSSFHIWLPLPPPPGSLWSSLIVSTFSSLYLVTSLFLVPQLGPIHTMRCQFWGPLSFHHLHLGAYPVLSSPPQAPGQAAKPPAAPNPPAPARPQRPPSHLPESGPTAHWARGWGPPGGPAGGAW